ncbi:anti-sigma factor [Pseudacidobacterium ailaaui]|jgi:anti-sigma-K factor RskA|uniref:anti-sigma factor n=1 Tax=Pseudacidobacterium ailaaui TaxID=1382359 RepID=UPI00047E5573|nr:anti-sigma factor [Pseudacidobacterium ailaaui]
MMNGHPQFDEDFDLYALGVLDEGERAEMSAHLQNCAACREKLAQAQQRVSLVALTLPEQEPPAHVKRQLMERVHGTKSRTAVVEKQGPSPRVYWWSRPAFGWAFAAVFALLAVFFAWDAHQLRTTMQQDRARAEAQQAQVERARAVLDLLNARETQKVTLTALAEKPQPAGRVFYHPQHGLIFYAQNMPALPPDRVYELWLVPPQGDPIAAGTFSPDSRGNGTVILPPLPKDVPAKAFAVTIEPQGGVPKATGPKVLIGAA